MPDQIDTGHIDPADRVERELQRAAEPSDLVDDRIMPRPTDAQFIAAADAVDARQAAADELERIRELEEDRAREELGVSPTGPPPPPQPVDPLRALVKGQLGAALDQTVAAAEGIVDAARYAADLERSVVELLTTARNDHGDLFVRNLYAVDAQALERLRELVPAWTASDCIVVRLGDPRSRALDDFSPNLMGLPDADRRLWARARRGLQPGQVVRLPRELGQRLITLGHGTLEEG